MNPPPPRFYALVLLSVLAAGAASSQETPAVLAQAAPGFDGALISAAQNPGGAPDAAVLNAALDAAKAGKPLPAAATPDVLARAYAGAALSSPQTLDEACRYLESRGDTGRAAAARLRAQAAARPASDPGAAPARIPAAGVVEALQNGNLTKDGARAFDASVPHSGDVAGPAAGGPAGAAAAPKPSGLAAAAQPFETAFKPGPDGKLKIVSISMEKLDEIAQKQEYAERKEDLHKAFNVGRGDTISGGGVFSAKLLTPQEVAADPVRRAIRDAAAKKGQKIVFVRTDVKAQLGGGVALPVEVGGIEHVSAGAGLSLNGFVEIVETRAVPEDKAGALLHAEQRTHLWPLTAERLRKDLRPGEELVITGRLDEGASAGVGAGAGLGLARFAEIGTGASAGAGRGRDQWITLRVKKIDDDRVRVLVQRADGETFGENVRAFAGLDVYQDCFIPAVTPPTLESGLIGKAVVGGEKSALRQIQTLASAELSASWGQGKEDVASEGWGAVPLDDPRAAAALDSFFKFKPDAMRGLAADETFSKALKSGRIDAEVRDVTRSAAFMAHLSKLKITVADGTQYYEIRWRDDAGAVRHFVAGVNAMNFHGDVTKSNRASRSVIWYDLDTGKASLTIALGPQDRLMTTTRERVNDVIATQQALGARLDDPKIDEPSTYLQFFHLANYGRSVETGQFSLSPEGVDALKTADRGSLLAAHLRADWLYEKQSFPPGKNFWGAAKPPVWADPSADPERMRKTLDFLGAHAEDVSPGSADDDRAQELQRDYAELAPGRSLTADAERFRTADQFARDVRRMQDSGSPEQLIQMFLKIRSGDESALKRTVVAAASLAGSRQAPDGARVPNWQGYLQMTGDRVRLVPAGGPPPLPDNPIDQLNAALGRWQQ